MEHGFDFAKRVFDKDVFYELFAENAVKSSTAMMLSMPRAFKPLMMLLPMKPAAPVTTIFMRITPDN
jgi:hypothetical protein